MRDSATPGQGAEAGQGEKMSEKITVTLKNNDEGFLGQTSPDELNMSATLAAYNKSLGDQLAKAFPEIEFDLDYGPYAGPSIVITGVDDPREKDLLSEDIAAIVERVYNLGDFWVSA